MNKTTLQDVKAEEKLLGIFIYNQYYILLEWLKLKHEAALLRYQRKNTLSTKKVKTKLLFESYLDKK